MRIYLPLSTYPQRVAQYNYDLDQIVTSIYDLIQSNN